MSIERTVAIDFIVNQQKAAEGLTELANIVNQQTEPAFKLIKQNLLLMDQRFQQVGDKVNIVGNSFSSTTSKAKPLDKELKNKADDAEAAGNAFDNLGNMFQGLGDRLFKIGRTMGFTGFVLQVTFQRINNMILGTINTIAQFILSNADLGNAFSWLEDTLTALAMAGADDAWIDMAVAAWGDYFNAIIKFQGELAKLKVLALPFITVMVEEGSRLLANVVNYITTIGAQLDKTTGKTNYQLWLEGFANAMSILSDYIFKAIVVWLDLLKDPKKLSEFLANIAKALGGFTLGFSEATLSSITAVIDLLNSFGEDVDIGELARKFGNFSATMEHVGIALTLVGAPLQLVGEALGGLGTALKIVGEIIKMNWIGTLADKFFSLFAGSTAAKVGVTGILSPLEYFIGSVKIAIGVNGGLYAVMVSLGAIFAAVGVAALILYGYWERLWNAITQYLVPSIGNLFGAFADLFDMGWLNVDLFDKLVIAVYPFSLQIERLIVIISFLINLFAFLVEAAKLGIEAVGGAIWGFLNPLADKSALNKDMDKTIAKMKELQDAMVGPESDYVKWKDTWVGHEKGYNPFRTEPSVKPETPKFGTGSDLWEKIKNMSPEEVDEWYKNLPKVSANAPSMELSAQQTTMSELNTTVKEILAFIKGNGLTQLVRNEIKTDIENYYAGETDLSDYTDAISRDMAMKAQRGGYRGTG